MTAIPEGIMQAAYDAADEAELSCGTSGGCIRPDCNGFLCRNAIDAAIEGHRRSPLAESWKRIEERQRAIRSQKDDG